MRNRRLTVVVLGVVLGVQSGGAFATNRFDAQGSSVDGHGSYGSGSVTVHHNLLQAERDELIKLINDNKAMFLSEIDRLETELDLTRDALAGDVAELHAKTDVVQVAADNAQASADEALRQADALYQELDQVEQEVVATQLAVQQAQRAADDAQSTADLAQAEAEVALAAANAADALARLARHEAAAAEKTAKTAEGLANAAEKTAKTAEGLANQGIEDALDAYRHAEKAQELANAARNKADMAYRLAEEAYAIGVPAGAYAYFDNVTCPNGWVHANGSNGSVDLRGQFIRSWDAGKGVDSDRVLASLQGDAIRNIEALFSAAGGFVIDRISGAFYDPGTRDGRYLSAPLQHEPVLDDIGFDASLVVPTANENRPKNVALLTCMKQ